MKWIIEFVIGVYLHNVFMEWHCSTFFMKRCSLVEFLSISIYVEKKGFHFFFTFMRFELDLKYSRACCLRNMLGAVFDAIIKENFLQILLSGKRNVVRKNMSL